jgi:hypothetical protein
MRTAPTRSEPRICLSTQPTAPAMIESSSASSSLKAVSIRQATSGARDRTSRQTDTPSPSGSRISRTATAGRSA